MTTQLNLKFQDDFFNIAKEFAKKRGYLSVQELIREALRDKIFDEHTVCEEYKKVLSSKEANSFSSIKESEEFIEQLRKT